MENTTNQPRDLVKELEALDGAQFDKPRILRLAREIVGHNRNWQTEWNRQQMAPVDLPTLPVLHNFLRQMRWELKVLTTEPLTLTWQVRLAGDGEKIDGTSYLLGVYVGSLGVLQLSTVPSKQPLNAELEMYFLRRALRDLIVLPGLQGIYQRWMGIQQKMLEAPLMPPLEIVRQFILRETETVPLEAGAPASPAPATPDGSPDGSGAA